MKSWQATQWQGIKTTHMHNPTQICSRYCHFYFHLTLSHAFYQTAVCRQRSASYGCASLIRCNYKLVLHMKTISVLLVWCVPAYFKLSLSSSVGDLARCISALVWSHYLSPIISTPNCCSLATHCPLMGKPCVTSRRNQFARFNTLTLMSPDNWMCWAKGCSLIKLSVVCEDYKSTHYSPVNLMYLFSTTYTNSLELASLIAVICSKCWFPSSSVTRLHLPQINFFY